MDRCIKCGKTVEEPEAGNFLKWNGTDLLVCCPVCKQKFYLESNRYLAVAKSLYGNPRSTRLVRENVSVTEKTCRPEDGLELIGMLRRLKESFELLERSNIALNHHFDQISASRGLAGLRRSLCDHRMMMEALEEELAIHAGICRFVLSVGESSLSEVPANKEVN